MIITYKLITSSGQAAQNIDLLRGEGFDNGKFIQRFKKQNPWQSSYRPQEVPGLEWAPGRAVREQRA